MPHTQSRYMQDLGFTDGEMFLGVGDVVPNVVGAGGATITRNNPGDWSLNQLSSLTVIYGVNVTNAILRRGGFGEDLQEQFGGAGIAGSAQVQQYRPDVIPAMSAAQELQPRTAFKLKGFKLLELDVVYQTKVLALTSISLRIDQSNFSNNVALVPTVVIAAGANGLSTAVQSTGPSVTTVVLPAAQQIYRLSSDSSLWIDLTVVTPATSTFQLYGFDCDFEFNYN
jgi:hypothetical protein